MKGKQRGSIIGGDTEDKPGIYWSRSDLDPDLGR